MNPIMHHLGPFDNMDNVCHNDDGIETHIHTWGETMTIKWQSTPTPKMVCDFITNQMGEHETTHIVPWFNDDTIVIHIMASIYHHDKIAISWVHVGESNIDETNMHMPTPIPWTPQMAHDVLTTIINY